MLQGKLGAVKRPPCTGIPLTATYPYLVLQGRDGKGVEREESQVSLVHKAPKVLLALKDPLDLLDSPELTFKDIKTYLVLKDPKDALVLKDPKDTRDSLDPVRVVLSTHDGRGPLVLILQAPHSCTVKELKTESRYNEVGGVANLLCMPDDPDYFTTYQPPLCGQIYGI